MPTPSADAESITVYSDYVCPFCYLGTRSLERYREARDTPLDVDWHPFDLRSGKRRSDGSIDHAVDDGKDEAYFEEAKENVRRLRERYDVEMTQELALEVDSLPAQLAAYSVKREHPDRWKAFDEAIFHALWRVGDDIGDVDVLVDLAEEVGVPGADIEVAVADDELRAELEERFTDARKRGVTGVPTFVHDGYAARGAVPPEHIARLVEGES